MTTHIAHLQLPTLTAKPGDIVVYTAAPDATHEEVVRVAGELRTHLIDGAVLLFMPHGSSLTVLTDDALAQLGLMRRDADARAHPTPA